MISFITLIVSGFLLLLLRWWIQKRMQGIVLLLQGSKKLSIYFYSLVFLPGVIVHELSHFLAAAFLAVPTGEIAIFPKVNNEEMDTETRVALGSVQIAKTDFVRGSLIGAAPFFTGSILLYVVVHLYFRDLLAFEGILGFFNMLVLNREFLQKPLTFLWLYAILALGNTMFVSREDTRSFPVLFVILGIIGLVLLKSGASGDVFAWISPKVVVFSHALSRTFAFVVVIDLVLVAGLFFIGKLLERVTGRRIRYGNR